MLRIGLAGVGYLGSRHLKHLLEISGVELAGIWDNSPAVREKVQSEFGIPVAKNFSALLDRSEAIVLVTPTSTHHELGMQVVSAGLPLFVEKPICAGFQEGAELVELAEEKGVMIQVGHIERFNRAFRALQTIQGESDRLVLPGQIPLASHTVKVRPRFIEAHRLAPWAGRGVDVAVVYDLMIHDLDLILSLVQSKISAVHASGVGVVTNSVDIANARIEFENGAVANITASRISLKRMRKIRIFGQQEYIALDFNKGTCEYVGACGDEASLPSGAEVLGAIGEGEHQVGLYRHFVEAPEGDAMRLELEAFRDAVVNGTPPPVTGVDGLKALILADRIVQVINGKK